MTTTLPPLTLAGYSDAELTEFYGATDDEAWQEQILAEAERRDREDARRKATARARVARQQDPLRLAWEEQAYAQYRAADDACCGSLLSHAGDQAADRIAEALGKHGQVLSTWPWPRLWTGPQWEADLYASEELRRYWESHPRLTFTQYREELKQQEEWYRNDQLDRDDASRVRQDAGSGSQDAPVRGDGRRDDVPPAAARGAAQAGETAGAVAGAGRPIRGGMTVDLIGGMARGMIRDAVQGASGSQNAARDAQRAHRDALLARARSLAAGAKASHGAAVAVRAQSGVVAARQPAVDGALVLDLVRAYVANYVSLPSAAAQATVTAWVAHAVARDRDDKGVGPLIWRASPRLLATSRNRGSGKSTLLDLIVILTRSRNGKMPKVTPRAFAEVVGQWYEVAAIDEAKLIFGSGKASQELQGLLLAGYTPRSSYAIKGKRWPVFSAVAFAGKDELITDTSGALGDLLDRTITIRMKAPSRPLPEVDDRAEDDGDMLAAALIAWTDSVRDELRQAAKDISAEDRETATEGANLRAAQIWRPLRAIGRVADRNVTLEDGEERVTGRWEAEITEAAEQLTGGAAGTEHHDLMAELLERSQAWGMPADDEPGQIITEEYGEEDED